MAKQTVQGLILERLEKMENKIDNMIPALEGLKVKMVIVSGVSGIVGTGILTAILAAFK